jgi:AbrB family looped-hinge helix DNA binding protein
MSATVVLDKAGRIVLPKAVRDELRLEPGDALELDSTGDTVSLKPVRSTTPLRKERGVWVFRTGTRLSAETSGKVLASVRERRHSRSAG